jgi:peptidoglycan hydrolase-like protein with peptidoglycan-binding domain
MNFAAILAAFLPSIIELVQAFPAIVSAFNRAPTNSLQAVSNVVSALPPALVAQLAQAGAVIFPKLSPELHAAAVALSVAHPDNTAWLQSAINLVISTGYIMGPALVVDGKFGNKTFAVVEELQAKAGLPVTGMAADAEYAVLNQLIAKIGG